MTWSALNICLMLPPHCILDCAKSGARRLIAQYLETMQQMQLAVRGPTNHQLKPNIHETAAWLVRRTVQSPPDKWANHELVQRKVSVAHSRLLLEAGKELLTWRRNARAQHQMWGVKCQFYVDPSGVSVLHCTVSGYGYGLRTSDRRAL
jgi:hypothetical protein